MALSDLQNQLEADQSGGGEIVDGAIDDLIMRSGDETERILLDLKNEVEEAKAKAKSSLLELEAFRKRYDGIEKENKALRVRLQDKGKFDSVRGGWRDRARLNNPSSFTAMPNQRVVSLGGEGPDSTIGLAELLKERDILITDLAAAREEIEVLRSGNLGRKDDRERIDELGKQLVSEKAKSKDLIEKHAPLPPLIKTLETLILTQKASLQAKDRQIHDLRQKQIDYPSAEKKFRAQIQEQQTMITSLQAKVQAEESAAKKSMDGMLESMRMMSTKVASFEGILKAKEERKQIEGSGSQDRGGEGREVARIPSSAEQAKILAHNEKAKNKKNLIGDREQQLHPLWNHRSSAPMRQNGRNTFPRTMEDAWDMDSHWVNSLGEDLQFVSTAKNAEKRKEHLLRWCGIATMEDMEMFGL